MSFAWTEVQSRRLSELGFSLSSEAGTFATENERDLAFKKTEYILVNQAKERLNEFRSQRRRPALCEMAEKLAAKLISQGFIQVTTPIILTKSMLAKMTIDDQHALFSQVFWLDDKKCLRPMLAPNLYYVSKDLLRLWEKPVGIFEIGSCFRKESQGNNHLNEFTMLNLVEWGLPEEKRHERIAELAKVVMETAGLPNYKLEAEKSVVYGDTIDVMYNDVEVASGAMGPHFLDGKWGITTTWVGLGFGLERLVMLKNGAPNVHSMGKSLTYLDGVRLNI
ncbi:MAG: hypothetical protein LLG02_02130 [Pelosinus sp.]|nr:hypothetical protein [Pelosinus sp.]